MSDELTGLFYGFSGLGLLSQLLLMRMQKRRLDLQGLRQLLNPMQWRKIKGRQEQSGSIEFNKFPIFRCHVSGVIYYHADPFTETSSRSYLRSFYFTFQVFTIYFFDKRKWKGKHGDGKLIAQSVSPELYNICMFL